MGRASPSISEAVAPIVETALDAVVVMRADGTIAEWNRQAEKTFGWSRAEAVGQQLADLLIPPELRAAHAQGLRRCLATGETRQLGRRLEVVALHRSGREVPVELSISATTIGEETLFLGFLRDLTEHRRAQDLHLEVSRVLTRRALEAELLVRITQLLTESETFEDALRASLRTVCETLGWSLGHAFVVREPAGLTSTEIWHPAGSDRFDAFRTTTARTQFSAGRGVVGAVLETGEPLWVGDIHRDEAFLRAASAAAAGLRGGFWFPVTSGGRTLAVLEFFSEKDAAPEAELLRMVRIIGEHIGRVFEREEAAQRLKAQAEELRTVQRVAKLGSWSRQLDGHGRWSEEVYRLFGRDPAEPAPFFQELLTMVAPEDRRRVVGAHVEGAPQTLSLEFTIVRPDGEPRVVWMERHLTRDPSGAVVGFHGIVQDVTARHAAAAQLRQAQKMEVVGQLTGGLAHDFNNLLSVVIGNLDFIESELPEDSPAKAFSDTALTAALKGAELTQQLLAFSRRQPLAPKVLDLNELVAGMTALVGRTIGEAISIRFTPSDDLRRATADAAQVESAVLNLVVNARDAMPGGGVLTIETQNARVTAAEAAAQVDTSPGEYVAIAVSDTGGGMPPDVLARACEPFFTTKEVGQGSGLGLSMIYGFAKQSGGHIRIYSEVGHGTTVRLFLPVAEEAAPEVPDHQHRSPPRARGERVLVVEDNEEVRRIAVRQLRDLGYDVLEADSGRAALDILETDSAVDVLFTDIVMPGGMSGIELAEQARRSDPGLRVLYTSGFTERAAAVAEGAAVSGRLLGKPYRKTELATRIRETLDAA